MTPPTPIAADRAGITWPAERLFWAVLDCPGWRGSGLLPQGLRPELDDESPLEPGALHGVCTPLGDGRRVLVCAAPRSELESLPEGTLSLRPAGLPSWLELGEGGNRDAAMLAASLELLVGPFEPRPLRRARLRRHLLAAACLLLIAGLTSAGLARRALHWNHVADVAASARASLVRESAPEAPPLAPGLPPELRLTAELARLRALAESSGRIGPAPDAALALAEILSLWPTEVPSRPLSLVASGSDATLSVALDGDAAPFLRALRVPQGWTALEPRLQSSGGITRLTLGLRAAESEVMP